MRDELGKRTPFELDGPREETTLQLVYLHNGPRVIGAGIRMSIEGGKNLTLLLDTGASGLLLTQAAIDRAGLNHVGSSQVGGVGDKGMRNAFFAVADTCTLGALRYKSCVFGAAEGKKGITDTTDGLLGTDVFSDYLITIDFQQRTLHLVPLPERERNPQGYDRERLPSEAGFTPVFRFGHLLEVLTKVNGKSTGLFAIDTGSEVSFVDSTFARLTTKIHGDDYLRVKGLSGSVKQVFEADKAELQFARFRQRNLGLTSIDLNNHPEHQEARVDGILGFPILTLFRLSLDYRNGLVNFDYILDRK